MKSFRRICLILTVLVVLFLLIGLPGTATNESSNNTRTTTIYPSISPNTPNTDLGYVSAFQTSTTDPYYAESAFLYVGTAGSTIYDTDLLKSTGGGDHQISSQNFDAVTAYDGLITTGDERGYSYSETKVYDPQTHTSHEIYPYAPYASYAVSSETINYGNSTGVDDAKTYNGINENITESNTGEYRPSTMGLDDDTGESIVALWDADGNSYEVEAEQLGNGETMRIDEWDVGYVGGPITRVELWVNFTVDSPTKYNGDNSLQYRKEGGTYQDTTITPVGDDVKNETYFVISDSFNSVQELEDLDVRFVNNDSSPFLDPVYFDRVWLVVTSGYQMNIQHSIASIPSGADAYELWIYGNYTSGAQEGDKINVEVQNFQFGWDSLGSLEITPSQGWYRFSLDPGRHLLGNSITIRYSDTTPDTEESTISIDVAQVRIYAGTLDYDLDVYYNFTWSETGDEKNISIYDVRSSSQDVDLYIFDWEATPSLQWVLLTPNATFSIDSSYTNYTYILNSNPGRFIDDTTDEIRIRYLETDSSDSSSLEVDYLGVNIHNVAGSDQKINIEYDIDDFTSDRSTVTQIRVVDSSIVSSGSVNAQIFNFTSYQWESCFDVTDTDIVPDHSFTFATSPSDLISPNPGNILIRYVFSDGTATTLSVDYLRVEVTYTSEDGGNGGGGGGDGTSDGGGGGGGGGTTVIRTLSASITYPEETEKYVSAEIDVTLNDDEGAFVSNASVTLTLGNETEPLELEEKENYYTVLLETDMLDMGNYTFTISAEKSGFRDFLSSAFPFNIVVTYPFATAVQYPEYWSEYTSQAVKNPISVLLDPSLYILPAIVTALITLQVTTFASIDPRKLRSIYVFTNEGQGLYYRTFFEEKGDIDSQLMSAALSGIVSLVMEATRSDKPIRTIDIETFEIFLEYGQFVTIATFVGKRIFYKRKIRRGQRKLIDNIERKYSQVLTQWDGDLSHFYELNQLVFDAFEFKLTKDLAKLIAGAAKVQLELVSLYSAQEKFHMSGRALWKAYDLYAQVKDRRAQFILERWKALEKAYLADYIGSTSVLKTRLLSQFFKLLDFIRTAGLLKILYKIRGIIYPEISKELYYFIPPEQLTERTDEGL